GRQRDEYFLIFHIYLHRYSRSPRNIRLRATCTHLAVASRIRVSRRTQGTSAPLARCVGDRIPGFQVITYQTRPADRRGILQDNEVARDDLAPIPPRARSKGPVRGRDPSFLPQGRAKRTGGANKGPAMSRRPSRCRRLWG